MFKCDKDDDIEQFLQEKSLDFEKRDLCRVYLILREEEFDKGHIYIEAYFTLSIRTLNFADGLSKTRIQKISGFRDKKSMPFVLLGQIGKYISSDYTSNITLSEILNYAYEVINSIDKMIPCNCILVECSEVVRELQIYENCGFTYFQKDGELYQYYRLIKR